MSSRTDPGTAEAAPLVVLGGGPAGYTAAFKAADLGIDVTLVEPAVNPGGVCLYRGCIPSKALLHVAKLLSEAGEAAAWGILFERPRIDFTRLREWKNGIIKQLTGGLGQLVKQRKIRHLRAWGRFADAHTLDLQPAEGVEGVPETLRFEQCIIATGSSPATVPGIDMASPHVWDSTGALALTDIAERLLVIGGGYIGLELGQVYATLGTRVSVVEMMDGLLPGADRNLVKPLQRRLETQFEAIELKTKVTGVEDTDDGVKVAFENHKGETAEGTFDRVLVAVGRRPNTKGLGLEGLGIEPDARGFIPVDGQRRTTAHPHLFAIGDVAGEPMLAHKGGHEGIVAAEAAAGHKAVYEPKCIPAVVFTDPEIAWAGVTEAQAKQEGLDVEVTRFPWAASGRALTMARTEGLTKLLFDRGTGRVLGVGIVGPGAGEMIAEGALAIEMAATAEDLAMTIHTHPTLSETVMEAAEMVLGSATHVYRPTRNKK